MAIKKWEEYSNEEKTDYLVYWFCQYGNQIFTFQELEDFRNLAKEKYDDIFDHIIVTLMVAGTIQSGVLLDCMRAGEIDGLFKLNCIKNKLKQDNPEKYEKAREIVVAEITGQNQNKSSEESEKVSETGEENQKEEGFQNKKQNTAI